MSWPEAAVQIAFIIVVGLVILAFLSRRKP